MINPCIDSDYIINNLKKYGTIKDILSHVHIKEISIHNGVSDNLIPRLVKENIKFKNYPSIKNITISSGNVNDNHMNKGLTKIINLIRCNNELANIPDNYKDVTEVSNLFNYSKKTIYLVGLYVDKGILDLLEGLDFDYLILVDCITKSPILNISKFIFLFNSHILKMVEPCDRKRIISIGNQLEYQGCFNFCRVIHKEGEHITGGFNDEDKILINVVNYMNNTIQIKPDREAEPIEFGGLLKSLKNITIDAADLGIIDLIDFTGAETIEIYNCNEKTIITGFLSKVKVMIY